MPYLRFSRDKRGYENTYVLHTFRGKRGPEPRLLYWFRTPPGARVGRHPLDEEAIRALEASNPGLDFDWSEMLKVRMPPRPPETRRGKQQAARKEVRGAPRAAASQTPAAAPAAPPAEEVTQSAPPAENLPSPEEILEQDEPSPEEILAEDVEAADEVEPWEHPVVALMGEEMLARLRARYAEIQVRIAEQGVVPAAREAARERARALNPDSWDTTEDAVRGIETFEAEAEAIRTLLGRRPSRQDIDDTEDEEDAEDEDYDPPSGYPPAADDDTE